MTSEVAFDVLEQILIGLDVKDIIRCKSVCKSWQSFISSPRFIKAHMKKQDRGDRRICSVNSTCKNDESFSGNNMFIVGSCNGLVCVSPRDVKLEVTNPCTRETRELQTPPCRPRSLKTRCGVECMGFGYDASTYDYKVIAGFRNSKRKLFYLLTLKSNIWKVIGEVKYMTLTNRSGILCGGALHWIMLGKKKKKVIISLDLSTEEFEEIPLPTEAHRFYSPRLCVIEGCLCLYIDSFASSSKKWVMKNNKWELYYYNDKSEYDFVYCLQRWHRRVVDSRKTTRYFYTNALAMVVPRSRDHISDSIYVKSLVSPYPHKVCFLLAYIIIYLIN
ncbi:putative F-box domain-containing protein [Helianthus debilis subsp. tardiflorus]